MTNHSSHPALFLNLNPCLLRLFTLVVVQYNIFPRLLSEQRPIGMDIELRDLTTAGFEFESRFGYQGLRFRISEYFGFRFVLVLYINLFHVGGEPEPSTATMS